MSTCSFESLYATTLDKNFLARAVCLYESWAEHVNTGMFGFYCMDEESFGILERLSLQRTVIVGHEEFTTEGLREVRQRRSMAEYCWTCKPAILSHALEANRQLDWVVYLDSDMMFFQDANAALAANPGEVLLTPHRFSTEFLSYEESVGRYNAGCVGFRNSSRGREALEWWRSRCLEWCGAIPEAGKYSDQKYLDQLPELFEVEIRESKGLNVAPWNLDNYVVSKGPEGVYVDEEVNTKYHFQGLKVYNRFLYDMYSGSKRLSKEAIELIYRPYIRRLAGCIDKVRGVGGYRSWGIQSLVSEPRLILWGAQRFLQGASNFAIAG